VFRIFLFDIDGTLISTGGAGTKALNLAFKDVFSIESAFQGVEMAGKTDIQIIKDGFFRFQIHNIQKMDDVIESYLEHLKREIKISSKYVKPGVRELLDELKVNNIPCGLITGNLRDGARIKLDSLDIYGYFLDGAFGSDNEDRNKLLPIAIERFRTLLMREINPEQCVVIGDTPRDVFCAKPYGATTVAVATGPYDIKTLNATGADVVLESLIDYKSLMDFLLTSHKTNKCRTFAP